MASAGVFALLQAVAFFNYLRGFLTKSDFKVPDKLFRNKSLLFLEFYSKKIRGPAYLRETTVDLNIVLFKYLFMVIFNQICYYLDLYIRNL